MTDDSPAPDDGHRRTRSRRSARPFRLALVGAGRMGRTHLAALAASRVVKVTDVVDTAPAVHAHQERAGFRLYSDLDEVFTNAPPDGVLVAAPTDEHTRLTRQAVAAGVPVLCEKPAGRSVAELRETGRLAARRRVPVQVGYWRRYLPTLVDLRQRIRSGALGTIYLVAMSQWDGEPPAATFRATSGGIMLDMGVHEIDQIRWLTGEEVTDVQAIAAMHVEDPQVVNDHDSAFATLRLSGGSVGTLSLGRYHPAGDMVAVEVFGTRGHEARLLLDPTAPGSALHDALRAQVESFAELVWTGRRDGADLSDAARAVAVAQSATRALSRAKSAPARR